MENRVSAILLAAGLSRRMGTAKQLLLLKNKPVIMHCIDNIIASGINDLIVVLGSEGRPIEKKIHHLPLFIVFNNEPSSEMSESVRIGLSAVDQNATGVLVCLSDHPLVSPNTLKTLIDRYLKEPDKIIVPVYGGRRGHPCLFPKYIANEVFKGFTLRDVVNKNKERVTCVEVPDEGILFDMDTKEDYRKITERMT